MAETMLTIKVKPKAGRRGWFEARAISTLPVLMGKLTVTGNSELTALRGLLEVLSRRVIDLDNAPTADELDAALAMAEPGGYA